MEDMKVPTRTVVGKLQAKKEPKEMTRGSRKDGSTWVLYSTGYKINGEWHNEAGFGSESTPPSELADNFKKFNVGEEIKLTEQQDKDRWSIVAMEHNFSIIDEPKEVKEEELTDKEFEVFTELSEDQENEVLNRIEFFEKHYPKCYNWVKNNKVFEGLPAEAKKDIATVKFLFIREGLRAR